MYTRIVAILKLFVFLHKPIVFLMYKPRLFLIIIFLSQFMLSLAEKRAFLVGISKYEEFGKSWSDIHGAEDVALLAPVLKKQGYKIKTLTEKEANYDNIVKGLGKLVTTCKPGDIVYIHFSTHGQPIEDTDGDEADGWDESIIPIDAYMFYERGKYEGERHLKDDQFKTILSKIRLKVGAKGQVIVAMDACHAGTLSRSEEEEYVRGTSTGFSRSGTLYHPRIIEKSNHYRVASSNNKAPILILEACRPYQRNTEVKIEEKYYGSLSYAIYMALKSTTLGTDNNVLLEKVKYEMRRTPNQNLVIESSN